ncbi:MAG: DUF547 domain-containing protein [Candidatus Dadabacteria bacterium]|nr:DUF547 domain-containing protein [Candidatus Dadabacteria bacterium]
MSFYASGVFIRVFSRVISWVLCFSVFAFSPLSEAGVWRMWEKHGDAAGAVSHKKWGDFLSRYVSVREDGLALFDYGGVSPEDKAVLDGYVAELSAASVRSFSRDEQFAYWVNLYNALTVQLVLDNYPVPSIKKIYTRLVSIGPWYKKLAVIEGEKISLNDIEHRILRPIWKDPRVHYAINCASIGCPNLVAAYTVRNTERLLEEAARAYVNHPRGAEVKGGKLFVSSIYKWFIEDFGDDNEGVIAHIKKYASPQLLKDLKGINKISGDSYDWDLNDTTGRLP